MFLNLIENIVLLLALSVIYSFVSRQWKKNEIPGQVISGILFASVVIVGMLYPFKYSPGVIFDGRSMLISIAGLFTGLISSIITSLIAIGYRIYLGGAGTLTGIGVVISSVAIGIIYRFLNKRDLIKITAFNLYLFGLIVHICMLLLMLTLPGDLGFKVLKNISIPVMIIFPIGTLFLGILLFDQQEKIRIEIELKKSENKYRTLFENMIAGFFYQDKNFNFIDVNDAALKIFDFSKKDFLNSSRLNEVFKVINEDGDDIELEKLPSRIALSTGKTVKNRIVGLYNRKKNDTQWLVVNALPQFKNKEKQPYQVIVTLHDITKRHNLQEQLIQSEKLSAVGQLASGIAHEFNNILAIVQINFQLMQLESGTLSIAKDNDFFSNIYEALDRGKSIVNNMISFARPQKKKKKVVAIKDVIENVIKLQAQQLRLANINCYTDYKTEGQVFIDKGQMEQVFLNLFINARHAILPKKKGDIKTTVFEVNDKVEIKVEDNGIGIEETMQNKIFTPFFSTKGAYAKDNLGIKGNGLGLSVVYRIVEEHKGTISVESKKDKGTIFTIILPKIVADKNSKKDKSEINIELNSPTNKK